MGRPKKIRRPGSGRKPTGHTKRPWTRRLAHDVVDYLATCANAAVAVEHAVRNTAGYVTWRLGSVPVLPDDATLPPEGD